MKVTKAHVKAQGENKQGLNVFKIPFSYNPYPLFTFKKTHRAK